MAVFPRLADPPHYQPHTFEACGNDRALAYWTGIFATQIDNVVHHAIETAGGTDDARRRAVSAKADVLAWVNRTGARPQDFPGFTLRDFDATRDRIMADHGFPDPHKAVKDRENAAALPLLPGVLAELDALPPDVRPPDAPLADARLAAFVRGVFAGNVFDLGTVETIRRFHDRGADFHKTRADLPPRPWLVDDYDALAARWASGPHRKALLMVDNAGADVVLGMLPLAREMVRRGTAVVLSANTGPSLNDITHDELVRVVDDAAGLDPMLADFLRSGRLRLVASGNHLPLLDFTKVSDALAAEGRDSDLLVLEGMGRALETNFRAPFTCDTLKIAMVKDAFVAQCLGGKPYDLVCKFEPATGTEP